MKIQPLQQWVLEYIDPEDYADFLSDSGPAFSLVTNNNAILGCAGVRELGLHRGESWALISEDIGTDFIHFHKAVLEFLKQVHLERVELSADVNHPETKRWAEMLGFKLEGLMHKFYPNGNDAYLYARVK